MKKKKAPKIADPFSNFAEPPRPQFLTNFNKQYGKMTVGSTAFRVIFLARLSSQPFGREKSSTEGTQTLVLSLIRSYKRNNFLLSYKGGCRFLP